LFLPFERRSMCEQWRFPPESILEFIRGL
jgi:hypothetical protein